MNGLIIVEGCDFTGKSTLIARLAKDLKAIAYKECDIPSNPDKAQAWVEQVNSLSRDRIIIADRCPAISEYIYGPVLRQVHSLTLHQSLRKLSNLNNLKAIVHCDPGLGQVMSCDNEVDQLEGVVSNLEVLHEVYGSYMDTLRSMGLHPISKVICQYDWTQPNGYEGLLTSLCTKLHPEDPEAAMVHAFHKKFGVPETWCPEDRPSREVFEFRSKFLQEELNEFISAMGGEEESLVKGFDALLDLVYVAKGTALMMGVTPTAWAQGMAEVQRANLSKVRATDATQSKRGSTLDVVKPQGWHGPEDRLKEILRSLGLPVKEQP